jgi:hypothetical protein
MSIKKTIQQQARRAPIYAVFGVAAWQSYWHIVEVAAKYGETESAYAIPLSLDGLLLLAQRHLTHARSRSARLLAAFIYAAGLAATLLANVAAAQPTPGGRILSAWPALSMVGASLLLHLHPQLEARHAATKRRTAAKAAAATRARNKAVANNTTSTNTTKLKVAS